MLSDFFAAETSQLALRGHEHDEVFRELIALIPKLNHESRAALFHALVERERLGSTGLGRGLALPHTRHLITGITRPLIVFGRHATGIDYGAPDAKPVRLFFLLVSPDVTRHLQILARLTRVLRDPHLCEDLLHAPDAESVIEFIQQADERREQRSAAVTVPG